MQVGDLVVHLHLPWITHVVLERMEHAGRVAIQVHGELHTQKSGWHRVEDWKVISESR